MIIFLGQKQPFLTICLQYPALFSSSSTAPLFPIILPPSLPSSPPPPSPSFSFLLTFFLWQQDRCCPSDPNHAEQTAEKLPCLSLLPSLLSLISTVFLSSSLAIWPSFLFFFLPFDLFYSFFFHSSSCNFIFYVIPHLFSLPFSTSPLSLLLFFPPFFPFTLLYLLSEFMWTLPAFPQQQDKKKTERRKVQKTQEEFRNS